MKKFAIVSLALALLFSVGFAQKRAESKKQIAPVAFEFSGTYQMPALPDLMVMKSPAIGNPATNLFLDTSDYEYAINSGSNKGIVALADNKVHMQWMNRNTLAAAPENRRAVRYGYYDGTTLVRAFPRPKSVAASGFGGIDVFRSGAAENFAVVVGHTPNWFSIDNGPGLGNFTTTAVTDGIQARNQLDPEITVDGDVLWFLDTGAPASRARYGVLKSTDFGTTWVLVDSALDTRGAPQAARHILASLDVPILDNPNNNNEVYIVTTLEGGGNHGLANPRIGTLSTRDSADQIGYFRTTNGGTNWSYTRIGADGDAITLGGKTYYIYFENFGQHYQQIDKLGNLHVVSMGYMVREVITATDTTYPTAFGTLYWRTGMTGWKLISNLSQLEFPGYDTYVRSGNALGFSYPALSVDMTKNVVYSVWSQPRITATTIDTADNGVVRYDLWHAYSIDNGNTWSMASKIPNTNDGLFAAANHTVTHPTATTFRAHITFISDTAAGAAPFGVGRRGPVPTFYRTIDLSSTTSVDDNVAPVKFTLDQNYPNPFNPTTSIRFELDRAANVTLKVFNVIGQEVATLINGNMPSGAHTHSFDASHLTSGVYMYRLEAGGNVALKKMVLMK